MKNLGRILVSALALWLTTLIVGGSGDQGVWIRSLGDETMASVTTFVVVAILFAAVNITVGKVFRFVAIPLRIITLGLFNLIINGALLLIVGWVSGIIGFGLEVDGFWWAVLGALVLSLITSVLNAVFGLSKKESRRR
ncbi:phage holin family protein [Leucobacter chinensis]|uniref:phage holin family protein n=1 Tax=Leucobacter chinensis TaxID=2851010 RepID=UPI001C242445|nr:phage holin family protein [Leucobacter chinensis]